jgi:hypothetical protein
MDLTCGNACYSDIIELEKSSVLVLYLATTSRKCCVIARSCLIAIMSRTRCGIADAAWVTRQINICHQCQHLHLRQSKGISSTGGQNHAACRSPSSQIRKGSAFLQKRIKLKWRSALDQPMFSTGLACRLLALNLAIGLHPRFSGLLAMLIMDRGGPYFYSHSQFFV